MTAENITRVILNNHIPSGIPKPSDFTIETVSAPTADILNDNELLVRPLYLSCDPYMRNRIKGNGGFYVPDIQAKAAITDPPGGCAANRLPPVRPFRVATGLGVCVVEASSSDRFAPGDHITTGLFDWAQKAIVPAEGRRKVNETDRVSLVDYIGVFGMPSFTAYVGTVVLGKPKKGETLLVTSAAGAVGQMVVQLAKARGLRVVAVAGSNDKIEFVKTLGADAAFNYKTCGNFEHAIHQAAPEGIDIYFDNVGGEFLDAALMNMRHHGRVIPCGMASQYNIAADDEYKMENFSQVIIRKLTIIGFLVMEYYPTASFTEFIAEVSTLYACGKITYKIDEIVGLENGPAALIDVFDGSNVGKRIIRV